MSPPLDSKPVRTPGDATSDSLVIANVSRRRFLHRSAAMSGFVLAVGLPATLRAADAPKYGADGMPHGWVDSPLVFALKISTVIVLARSCSCRSAKTERSASYAIDPRWGRAYAPACR